MRSNYISTKISKLSSLGRTHYLIKQTEGEVPILYSLSTGEENCNIAHAVAENCAIRRKHGCYIEYKNWI